MKAQETMARVRRAVKELNLSFAAAERAKLGVVVSAVGPGVRIKVQFYRQEELEMKEVK